MATEQELQSMISRAFIDTGYREMLITNPEQAAVEMGYEVTPEQSDALKGVDTVSSAALLERRISKQVFF